MTTCSWLGVKPWEIARPPPRKCGRHCKPDYFPLLSYNVSLAHRADCRYPHHSTSAESAEYARNRGRGLRELLAIPEDSYLIAVANVRDPFEHIDERLDHLMRDEVISVSDWYVSDGTVLLTPDAETIQSASGMGYGLRMFFPAGGILSFDDQTLDLYLLDLTILGLRKSIEMARKELAAKRSGRNLFGGPATSSYWGLS